MDHSTRTTRGESEESTVDDIGRPDKKEEGTAFRRKEAPFNEDNEEKQPDDIGGRGGSNRPTTTRRKDSSNDNKRRWRRKTAKTTRQGRRTVTVAPDDDDDRGSRTKPPDYAEGCEGGKQHSKTTLSSSSRIN